MPGSDVSFREFYIQVGYHRDAPTPYRHLWIEPLSSEGAPVAGVFALFEDAYDPAYGLGYYNPENNWVVGFALTREFDSVYRLLRSGTGLKFRWYADGDEKMVWFQFEGDHGVGAQFIREAEGLIRDQAYGLPDMRTKLSPPIPA